ncbi:MAG TPA: ATP-binding cassette domain-containing protein [Gemmatimonadaceae bacterium]|nr:ATP-binding cassette domain-containing protein [Gemmatimonadaceae bacterium]
MAELRAVRYVAGNAVILDDVSARFRPGAFNVILGPNGAGKSTLLRVATGLLRPTAGTVLYDDRPVRDFSPDALARKRAVLSQHVSLAFPLPVRDVVLMGRYPHFGRAPGAHDREIVSRALDLVGMREKGEQPYPTLSGGEQQKVQLARVLAQIWNEDAPREPKYLFLDEPTSSLDVHYQLHLLDVARGLLARECTVVAILHDLNVAFHYGDAFFVMDGGRVVLETDRASEIPPALIERVFRVRTHAVVDQETGERVWRFSL